jgi:hypothetical protein
MPNPDLGDACAIAFAEEPARTSAQSRTLSAFRIADLRSLKVSDGILVDGF